MFWNYNHLFSTPIPEQFQLNSDLETFTPLYQLSDIASTDELLEGVRIKDESKNSTGSQKDRSFRYWISYWALSGIHELVLSSSGSSAFAAAYYCQKANINLHIFLAEDFPESRLEQLKLYRIATIHQSKTPKRDAIRFSKEKNLHLLRGSMDDIALEGYKTIAFELAEQDSDIEELFIPTSSGATIAGIYKGYEILRQKDNAISIPRIYCIQTTKVHPIASELDPAIPREEDHPARAIIDRISHRKKQIIDILKETNGGGYVVSKEETNRALAVLQEKHGAESALTIAAALKHRALHPKYAKTKTVLLFTN